MNPTQKPRILIADDQEAGRIVLEAYLEPEGYEIIAARDGLDALDRVRRSRPDLVITDVLMPRLDGFDLCRSLRRDHALRDIPIIIITALDDREDKIRGIEAGCDDFIEKPFDREELLARVRSLLRLNWYRCRLAESTWFNEVLNSARDGIVVVGADWRLQHSNRTARRLLDLPEEFAGVDLLDRLYDGFEVNLDRRILESGADQEVEIHACRYSSHGAPTLFVDLRGKWVLGPEGRRDSLVLTVRDETSERQEEKLRWDFLSMVSHKLRTPVAVILEYASLFADGLMGDLSEEQREGIDAISKGARDLAGVFEKILEFLDAGRLIARRRAFDPAGVVVGLVGDLRKRYPGLRIDEARCGSAPRVQGPADVFRVVAWNLLENAAKFGSSGSLQLVWKLGYRDGRLELTIADSGRGIPSEQLDRIVAPFYQVEPDFTGNVPGMGLGLSIVSRLLDSVDGEMQIHSGVGQGTSITVRMPVQRVPSPAVAAG